MPKLKLRFPGGRYHATPWGHHVNEGLIEWPPSPWRLLRALIACGFSGLQWSEIPPIAEQLIYKLAAVLPSYRLPNVSAAHSRHYMPYMEGKSLKTTLVFDTWAHIGDEEVVIHWPAELSDSEAALLCQLANALGYLGRSESWVETEVVPDLHIDTADFNAFPHREGSHPGREFEQVSLMAAIPAEQYSVWQHNVTRAMLAELPLPEGKRRPAAKLLKDRAKAIDPYPPDLVSCLTKDTVWWKQQGWSQPPGSQRVLYWRRRDSLQVSVPKRPKPQPHRPVTTMLLSLTTPTGNRSALPPKTRTLPQAELFHRAIVARVGKGREVHCPELTGRDEHGRPLREQHSHAHTIPVDLDGDGHLDHLIIYANMGLGDAAQRAIRTLRQTWMKGGVGELQVALVGSGELNSLRQLPGSLNSKIEELLGSPEGSHVWESITPFVPPRFLKPRGKNALLGQINAELASRNLPEAETLDVEPCNELTRSLRHYVRRRSHGGAPPPVDMGFGLRLVFSEPIFGPLLLGYASHYGLGMFRSMTDQ